MSTPLLHEKPLRQTVADLMSRLVKLSEDNASLEARLRVALERVAALETLCVSKAWEALWEEVTTRL